MVNTFIVKVLLPGIVKSVGYKVLLQEQNRYVVQIYQRKFTIQKNLHHGAGSQTPLGT